MFRIFIPPALNEMNTAEFIYRYTHISPTRRGCVIWPLAHNADGTCTTYFEGRQTRTHIAAYRVFRIGVPYDMVLGHVCSTRYCVNPWHWEEMTQQRAILRGSCPAAINARKTRCIRGHELHQRATRRICLVCKGMRERGLPDPLQAERNNSLSASRRFTSP